MNFYSCKEIFIRSGYCKLLLNQYYNKYDNNIITIFVTNMNFRVHVLQLLPDPPT